ncbi:MAG: DUF5995 family protein [Anaerolineales bacterium]|jgi:hypothetical protein
MMTNTTEVIEQMDVLVAQWQATGDDKALFLDCYRMMTGNVLMAIKAHGFNDSDWVERLLSHFADYYFEALQDYQFNPDSAPQAWQLAHNAAADPHVTALQKLLLGVNAHINYDLVLTLVDLLADEWGQHNPAQRQERYTDHCQINQIIGQTIDAVQDQVLEPAMPVMALVDSLLGPVDEFLISGLISQWRELVWVNASGLLEMGDADQRTHRIAEIEQAVLRIGHMIW